MAVPSRFGARLALALLALTAPAARLRAQDADSIERARQEEHRMVLASERVTRFVERWAQADTPARAAAREWLERARPSGASIHWLPGPELLRRAESVLAGDAEALEDAEWARLDALAGALDLLVMPGAFEIQAGELTEPITVRVTRAWGGESANVELSLTWIDAAGSSSHARREAVDAGAFAARGFPMYLRAPVTGAGRCRLYGQLVRQPHEGFAAVAPEVRVDAVPNLRARLEALRERKLEGHPGYDRLRELLSRLLVAGLRGSTALGGGDMLLALERWSEEGPPTSLPAPIELGFTDARGVEHWLWSYAPARTPSRALVFLAHSGETADQPLAGALGAAWMAWAEAFGVQLFATHAPVQAVQVAALLERLREWSGGLELTVLARGDALGALSAGVAGRESPPFDAWIASTAIPDSTSAGLFPGVDGLLFAPAASSTQRVAPRSGLERAEGERVWLLNDPALPVRVAEWFARRSERR